MSDPQYSMKIELNVLNHLGIGLYSNIPAVMSEAVANAWDADAAHVWIDIDTEAKRIAIADDGHGMTRSDINGKYLAIGYQKREHDGATTAKGRHVMGRKGIGKLSLFSIANTIEVFSSRETSEGLQKNALRMTTVGIRDAMKENRPVYEPEALATDGAPDSPGTRIALSDLKVDPSVTAAFLRRRLARRFGVIGGEGFVVSIDGSPIGIADRDYLNKLEFVWTIGDEARQVTSDVPNLKRSAHLDGIIDDARKYRVTGWVGTFDERKSIEDGNNSIVLLAWGKLVHEDLLKDMGEGGIYTKYLIGEVSADFLDADDQEDIATSDRQHLKEEDERFLAVRDYVQKTVLKAVESRWRDWRGEQAEHRALENEAVRRWFDTLSKDNKKWARQLFTKIESFPIPDEGFRRTLYRHGILAFQTLAVSQNLSALDTIEGEADFAALSQVFADIDALEQAHYYQIAKGRLGVLEKFESLVDADAKEKVIQSHIFDHLWLLDPSWERASVDERMEQSVTREFDAIVAGLRQDERDARLDIRYRTAAGKHIIVELKRYDRQVSAYELAQQIGKYRSALDKCLRSVDPQGPRHIECICIVGRPPSPPEDRERVVDLLRAESGRFITYDQLIQQTRDSYRDYLDANRAIGKINAIVESI